ncbi:MAG TPA: condensation domain-containing protein, partial [Thermoanaerobaculia bacterium]
MDRMYEQQEEEQEAVDGFRISPQQKRAWLLRQPGAACGVHAALSVDGPLDCEALGRALDLVLERNEILSTVLRRPPGLTIPVQVIGEPERHALEPVDLPAAELASRIAQGAPLSSGPLGLELLRLAADRHVLLVSLPASHGDPAGLADLTREIARAYAFCRGEGEAPPEDRLQYADFAEWQIQMLESEESAPGREHWSRRDTSRLG